MIYSKFRNAISEADKYNFLLQKDSSIFWTGMRENGGEHVAKNYINRFGGNSLETTLGNQGFIRPTETWRPVSASFAMRSSGNVKVLVGTSPWSGSVWNTTEKILLNINPNVTSIKEIFGVTTQLTQRIFESKSLLSGIASGSGGLLSFLTNSK